MVREGGETAVVAAHSGSILHVGFPLSPGLDGIDTPITGAMVPQSPRPRGEPRTSVVGRPHVRDCGPSGRGSQLPAREMGRRQDRARALRPGAPREDK